MHIRCDIHGIRENCFRKILQILKNFALPKFAATRYYTQFPYVPIISVTLNFRMCSYYYTQFPYKYAVQH